MFSLHDKNFTQSIKYLRQKNMLLSKELAQKLNERFPQDKKYHPSYMTRLNKGHIPKKPYFIICLSLILNSDPRVLFLKAKEQILHNLSVSLDKKYQKEYEKYKDDFKEL